MYSINDLNQINEEIQPLKELADRERRSIYGLTGLVYTPHIDTYNAVAVQKAKILKYLKSNDLIAVSEMETISAKLMVLHRRAKNHQLVEFNGHSYKCVFSPLKLSKTGKIVRKWAKYWLRMLPNGNIDKQWDSEVREVWPENFLIKRSDYE